MIYDLYHLCDLCVELLSLLFYILAFKNVVWSMPCLLRDLMAHNTVMRSI